VGRRGVSQLDILTVIRNKHGQLNSFRDFITETLLLDLKNKTSEWPFIPESPWELVANLLGSAEHNLGTTGLEYSEILHQSFGIQSQSARLNAPEYSPLRLQHFFRCLCPFGGGAVEIRLCAQTTTLCRMRDSAHVTRSVRAPFIPVYIRMSQIVRGGGGWVHNSVGKKIFGC
jgi:hypothetical protein